MVTSFFVLAAVVALVAGLLVPGTSFILMCVSIAFSGIALAARLVRAARNGVAETSTDGADLADADVEGVPEPVEAAVAEPRPRPGAFEPPSVEDRRWDRLVFESRHLIESDVAAAPVGAGTLTDDIREALVRRINAQIRVEVDGMRRDLRELHEHFAATVMQRVEELGERQQATSGHLRELLAGEIAELREDVARGFHRLWELPTLHSVVTKDDLGTGLTELRENLASVRAFVATSASAVRSEIESLLGEVQGLRSAVTNADLDVRLAQLSARAGSLSTRSEVEELLANAMNELRSRMASLATFTAGLRDVVSSLSLDLREEVAELRAEVGRLRTRVLARPRRPQLDQNDVERVAESVRAAMKRLPAKKAAGVTSRADEQATKATAKRTAKATATAAPKKAAAATKAVRTAKGSDAAASRGDVRAPRKRAAATKKVLALKPRGAARVGGPTQS